ncbi:hypothetical protein AB0L40_14435 [Patulibacter sp. NPDC049589]|uniref:hypothetical protein n=1 Tax=Patulibacter sp. NPDC049589 TaxID=3154731 RepID=UPI0034383F09
MTKNKIALMGLATAAVAAGATTAVVAQADSDARAQAPLVRPALAILKNAPTEPSARLGSAVGNPDLADFGLHTGDTRSVRSGTWAIVPGDRGACFETPTGKLGCGPNDQLRAGGAGFGVWTPRMNPDAKVKRNADGTETVVNAIAVRGPASYAGIVPDDVARVVTRNAAGETVDTAPARDNVVDLTINDVAGIIDVATVRRDGSIARVEPGPAQWNRK